MTRALLLVDLQSGAFDGRHCDPMPDGEPLIATCLQLLAGARRRGEPVVWIQHAEAQRNAPMYRHGAGFAIDARLNPADDEPRIVKTEADAFNGTPLQATLKKLGVDTLVIAGLQSELCVQATAEAALRLGYPTSLIRDGHHTWPKSGHSATEVRKRVNEFLEDAGVTLISARDYA